MADVAKIEATMDYIKTHPEQHHQEQWAERTTCGTTYCFAGTTVMLAGYEFVWAELDPDLSHGSVEAWAGLCVLPKNHPCAPYWSDKDGNFLGEVADVAAHELGLNWHQRYLLFNYAKSVEDLEEAVKNIANNNKHWAA